MRHSGALFTSRRYNPRASMIGVLKLSSSETHEFWKIPVLYEDEHLLALDKPAGLATAPEDSAKRRPNLIGLLHGGIAQGKGWASERKLSYLMNVDRLDAETTGLLLLAKNKAVLQ